MIYRLLIVSCFTLIGQSSITAQHINGLTAVATPDSFPSDPYPRLSQTNANWVCLVPYGFSRIGQTELWYNMDRQWWGEKKEGVIKNIHLARKNNLKIFLKPQVYFPGGWPGDLDFKSDVEWQKWEAAYRTYILDYLDIAIAYDVEMFCIGTEFKVSVQKRPSFWKKLIADIRCLYSGDLTYSANWDSYAGISFWGDLDYVGISSYFPLTDEQTPNTKTLAKAWKPVKKKLSEVYKKLEKPILFTEYGYLTVDGCAGKTWELEKAVHQFAINEEAQAISFDILYAQFWEEEFWAGGFIWKWFPHGQGHEGYLEKDYTPQDKLAEKTIAKWFGKDKK